MIYTDGWPLVRLVSHRIPSSSSLESSASNLAGQKTSNQCLFSRWHHKKKKQRQQAIPWWQKTYSKTCMTSEVTRFCLPIYPVCLIPLWTSASTVRKLLHGSKTQLHASWSKISIHKVVVFARSLHKEQGRFLWDRWHSRSERALSNCNGQSRFWGICVRSPPVWPQKGHAFPPQPPHLHRDG